MAHVNYLQQLVCRLHHGHISPISPILFIAAMFVYRLSAPALLHLTRHIPSLPFWPSSVSTRIFNCVVFGPDFQDFPRKSSFCYSLLWGPPLTMRAGLRCDVTAATVLRRRQRSAASSGLLAAKLWEENGIVTIRAVNDPLVLTIHWFLAKKKNSDREWIRCRPLIRSVFHLCSLCSSWSQNGYVVPLELLLQAITLL